MYQYKARVIRIVDGDTMDVDIDLGFDIHTHTRVRVLDLDTPETWRPISMDEREHGMQAKAEARRLLFGKELTVETSKGKGKGKYGRWLVKIILPNGWDYAEYMNLNGFAKRKSYILD